MLRPLERMAGSAAVQALKGNHQDIFFEFRSPQELLAKAADVPVEVVCGICDADWLAELGSHWLQYPEPAARNLLRQYLRQPFCNAGHERLVRAILAAAEQAGDDEIMGLLLAAFDRSIRRERCDASGAEKTALLNTPRGTVLPPVRRRLIGRTGVQRIRLEEPHEQVMARNHRFLFRVRTRRYLQRRLWRYFRRLAADRPSRCLRAVVRCLWQYTDADCGTGTALLDCTGLVRILFQNSMVIELRTGGWNLAAGRTLSEIQPAPAFPAIWNSRSDLLIRSLWQLAAHPHCTVIRRWAGLWLLQHPALLQQGQVAELSECISAAGGDETPAGIDQLLGMVEQGTVRTAEWPILLQHLGKSSEHPAAGRVLDAIVANQDNLASVLCNASCLSERLLAGLLRPWSHLELTNCEEQRAVIRLATRGDLSDPSWLLVWACGCAQQLRQDQTATVADRIQNSRILASLTALFTGVYRGKYRELRRSMLRLLLERAEACPEHREILDPTLAAALDSASAADRELIFRLVHEAKRIACP